MAGMQGLMGLVGPNGNVQQFDTLGAETTNLSDATITALGSAIATGVTGASSSQLFFNAGAPTSGPTGTFAGVAIKGAQLFDTTNKVLYANVNTLASPTWSAIEAVPATVSPTITTNAVTLSVLPGITNLIAASGFSTAGVISLPAAASSAGARFRAKVAGSASKTYAFSTNSSTGVSAFVGGTPVYSTTAVPDYFEGFCDGTGWFGTLAAIGMS